MGDEFTYNYLIRVFEVAQEKFALRLLGDGFANQVSQPQLFLRHDVDVSIKRALDLARLEAEHGMYATYMFIPNSRLYDIEKSSAALREIISLGHEVALHFDVDDTGREQSATVDDVLADIERDCQIISQVTGTVVRSVSFHRPMAHFLRGEITIDGRTNAYAADLMECYISDSKGQWKHGDPITRLQAATAPVVQLLIHPIWYGADARSAEKRLEDFFMDETQSFDRDDTDRFDKDLAFTVPGVRRSGKVDTLWAR